jgi:hypothetical protein
MTPHGDVGLADLARCLRWLQPDGRAVEALAAALGLELPAELLPARPEPPPRDDDGHGDGEDPDVGGGTDAPLNPPTLAGASIVETGLPRLRPVGPDERTLSTPWRAAQPLEPFDAARHLAQEDGRPPLFDERWTREVLSALLATEHADGRLDEDAAVRRIARGLPLDPLPLVLRRSLRRGAQVLVDVGEGMEPFIDDAWELVRRVQRLVGEGSVTTSAFWDAPLRGVGAALEDYAAPPPQCPVLAVTDAGIGGPPVRLERSRPDEWLELADQLGERGSPLILVVPYPLERWPGQLRRTLLMVEWDRTTTAVRAHALRRRR